MTEPYRRHAKMQPLTLIHAVRPRWRVAWFVWCIAIWLGGSFGAGGGGVACAAPVAVIIQLVDAEQGVPLEYWVKDELLPNQAMLYHRMPTALVIDGTSHAFANGDAGAADALTGTDTPALPDAALAGLDPGAEATRTEVASDRTADVMNGLRALLTVQLAPGAHTLFPGNIAFTVGPDGRIVSPSTALHQLPSGILQVRCSAVDMNLLSAAPKETATTLQVKAGDRAVYAGEMLRVPSSGAAVRLYLPPGDVAYTAACSLGTATFTVTPSPLPSTATDTTTSTPAAPPASAPRADILQVVLTDRTIPAPPLSSPRPTTTDPDTGAELYIFTDRNRAVYLEGETVALSVRGWHLKGADVYLELIQGKHIISLRKSTIESTPDAPEAAGGELQLDTTFLRPGLYTVRARGQDVASNSLTLTLVSAIPATHLKLFGWYKWGSDSFDPADLEAAVQNGLNLVSQGAGHSQGGTPLSPDASPFADWSASRRGGTGKATPLTATGGSGPHRPTELDEAPLTNDQGAEFLLAHGIQNLPQVGSMILYFNVGSYWQEHANDRYQTVAQIAQEWRRFPNFVGLSHTGGDGPTPATSGMVWAAGASSYDIIHDQRLALLRRVFESQNGGKIALDDSAASAEFKRINAAMNGAIGYGVGMDTSVKVIGDDATKVAWTRWLNDLYPACFRAEREALEAQVRDPLLLCGVTWGNGAGSGMWTPTFYAPLSGAMSDLHGDYGIIPFSYVSGIDLLSAGSSPTQRPWMGLDLLPERPLANGFKLFLQAMSRNPAGIGVLNTKSEVAGGWGYGKATSDQMRLLTDIGKRFGDTLLHLERHDEVAVLTSLRQAALGGQSFERLWGAHFLLSKAGYQAAYLTEEQVLANRDVLKRYKALMLTDMPTKLPPELLDTLVTWHAGGGVVIFDELTPVPPGLEGSPVVTSSEVRGANEVNYHAIYDRFAPLQIAARATLRPVVPPFFTADKEHVHLNRSVDGDLEFWTLYHDGIPGSDEYKNGHFAQFLYRGTRARVTAAASGTLVDALRRHAVTTTTLPTGGIAWDVDLSSLPGTYYLFTARSVDRLAVDAPTSATCGTTITLHAALFDADGKPLRGHAPLELVVTDGDGAERYRIYRTTDADLPLKIAANDATGDWHWQATEQSTGLTVSGVIAVSGGAVVGDESASTGWHTTETRPVTILDPLAIHSALRNRAFDIVLYPGQEAMQAVAERLAAGLTERGCKVQIRLITPARTRRIPMNWKVFTIEDRAAESAFLSGSVVGQRVPGKNQNGDRSVTPEMSFYRQYTGSAEWLYARDVILLGRTDLPSNPLMDHITVRCRMLARNPSPNFPARGQGLIGYAWAPFHYGHDALVVYGRDAAGLERTVDALVGLAMPNIVSAQFPPRLGGGVNSDAILFPPALPTTAGALARVESRERQSLNLLPATFERTLSDAVAEGSRIVVKSSTVLSADAPPFAVIDATTGEAVRLQSANPIVRNADLGTMLENLAITGLALPPTGATELQTRDGAWLPQPRRRLRDGILVPSESGLARLDASGARRWFYTPQPVAPTFRFARYQRRCQEICIAPDEKTALATFYDVNTGANYGPTFRMMNPGVTVLLDLETGRELRRYDGYCAGPMALAADGSRAIIVDNVIFDSLDSRFTWNPQGEFVLAAFTRDSTKATWHMPVHDLDRFVASADARRAVLSYRDARRYVSLVDTAAQQEVRLEYPRVDTGIAIAPDGSFAIIAYADGQVHRVDFSGKVLAAAQLAAPGLPLVLDDGRCVVVGADAHLYTVFGDVNPAATALPSFDDAPVLAITADTTPANGFRPPQSLFWDALPAPLKPAAAGKAVTLAEPTHVDTTRDFDLQAPATPGMGVALYSLRYRLDDPGDRLRLTVHVDGEADRSYDFPYDREARLATIALRQTGAGSVRLSVHSARGVTLDGGTWRVLRLDGWTNVAAISADLQGKQAPTLRVPNIDGALGDPRVEQYAFAYPKSGQALLPANPDERETRLPRLFDGDPHTATPLYPTVRPAGNQGWYPRQGRSTLRAAQLVMEFPTPVPVSALAIWERPGDLAVSAFTVEVSDRPGGLPSADDTADEWRLVLAVDGNSDAYHLHGFAKPITAKRWRLTVLDTNATIQSWAEIELLQSAEEAFLDLDAAGL